MFSYATIYSQASDFITVKKRNNRTLKTYFPGSSISCQTIFGSQINGTVQAIHNDSVFIKQYDVRAVPNRWGVLSVDTMGSYITGIHYKDIDIINFQRRNSFGFIKNGTVFIIGGLGYASLNLINGRYLNESIGSRENKKSLAIALGIAGAGYLMNRLHRLNNRRGKKYRIAYVHMNTPARNAF